MTDNIINKEKFNNMLLSENAGEQIVNNLDRLLEIIPEMRPMIGFEQNSPWHDFDVFTHTIKSIDNAPPYLILRLTLFFHDFGKPHRYVESEDGVGHFYGHPKVSADIAGDVLTRMGYDESLIEVIKQLIIGHDSTIKPSKRILRRMLKKLGEERTRQLINIVKADKMAQTQEVTPELEQKYADCIKLLDEIGNERRLSISERFSG